MKRDPAQDAKDTLIHYFRLLCEKAGIKWTFEMQDEIARAVESIIAAAVLAAKDAP